MSPKTSGRAATRVPEAVRQLSLALAQVLAVTVPVAVVAILVARGRWRRLGVVVLAAAAGAAAVALLDAAVGLSHLVPGAVTTGTWVASTRFPSLVFLGASAAAAVVGKPWLSREWKRAVDVALAALVVVMALAGSAGVLELLLALAGGSTVGAALLVAFGSPNRRPAPAAVAAALNDAGLDVAGLTLQRAEGGRAQLYVADVSDGRQVFVKVYGRDSRDADLLYRSYRALLLRGPNDEWPSLSLKHDVEHEAFLLLLAGRSGVTCPRVELLAPLPDGSMALAMELVDGRRLDSLDAAEVTDELLDALWREVGTLHRARLAHRALRAANVLVTAGAAEDGADAAAPGGRPVIIDFGFADESAPPRLLAVDRAELLASVAVLVGADRAVASAVRVVDPTDLAAAVAFLQPLALSRGTRKQVSKSALADLRAGITAGTGMEAAPLERLVRVRPRTLVTIAAIVGAFYFLLPQLANVDDSFRAMRSANWGWLFVCALLSMLTYAAAAVSIIGGAPHQAVPLVPAVAAQMASSFVNRITPANVGGMTLNVRFLQKAGVDPASAVSAVGVSSVAGAVVHIALMVLFFSWAGHDGASAFRIPSGSKLLVVIAVVLALSGVVAATRRGRRLVKKHVLKGVKRSLSNIAEIAKSPGSLAALFGGSVAVTLCYIGAFAAAVAALHGHLSIAQVGAVYLGGAALAAAAPTPGGLGALEAALVAGLTGVGMEAGVAVAAVLSYRLLTYWLPILPGWISFRRLERRGYI